MENNTLDATSGFNSASGNSISGKIQSKVVKKTDSNLRSIHLSGNSFIIKEEAPIRSYQAFRLNDSNTELPGVFFHGTQYYDLKNIYFINNTGMANLIDLLESLLEKDVDVQFVNVCDKIKSKIKALGLDQILICS
jgi:ABC-type transporter Mla MlaB component